MLVVNRHGLLRNDVSDDWISGFDQFQASLI